MTTSPAEAETILAIDIGAVHTRAVLFDVAEGQYRLIALGQAMTTAAAPFQDVQIGTRQAIEQLQEITGRTFLDDDSQLVIPTQADGTGVDRMVVTASVGPGLNMVIAGLNSEVSMESAQRLAASTYGKIVETIGINDRRKTEVQVDAVIHADPDVIIVTGGTDEGADQPVAKLLEVVGLACYLLPAERRPTVLYAGNQSLQEKVKSTLEGLAPIQTASNLRPALAMEDLSPAEAALMQVAEQCRGRNVNGLPDIVRQASAPATTPAYGLGRMIRFLSRVNDGSKGVLGIDLGASATTVAAATGGHLQLNVYPLGMGETVVNLLDHSRIEEITQWLMLPIPDTTVRDYIHQKAICPGTLPVTPEDQAIEQAIARQILRCVTANFLHPHTNGRGNGRFYEPILATGAVLGQAPTPGQSLMMLLDGLQPTGVTTFVLDQNNLTASLGAIAGFNSVLPVQVFESGAFLYLGTVISPVSSARHGSTILEAKLVREDGTETELEVKQGSLYSLPVPHGQTAQLFLNPSNHTHIGMSRPGRGVKITGGVMGAVIDARGRPLNLATDPARRREMLKKWAWTLSA